MATSRINRDFFFQRVRQDLMGGSLKSSQVNGLTAILDEWEGGHADEDDRWLAYMLGTTHHETDRTIQPIHEYGNAARFRKLYDVEGDRPQTAINTATPRQATASNIVAAASCNSRGRTTTPQCRTVTGVDLVNNPDQAMDPLVATKVMFYGMINGHIYRQEAVGLFQQNSRRLGERTSHH